MARAKTIEAVGENEVGRNGPLPFHNTCCRMEVPRPLHNWPPTLGTAARTTGSGPGVAAVHLHARLEPLQALNLLPVPHPEGPEETQQVLPLSTPPSSPVGDQRDESSRGTDAPGERSGRNLLTRTKEPRCDGRTGTICCEQPLKADKDVFTQQELKYWISRNVATIYSWQNIS